ncbi:MAG: hypothetical protein M1118_02140 [Chloroflexi bacterium]|nr:hypothetical protein [Chloroflexota bacterium]
MPGFLAGPLGILLGRPLRERRRLPLAGAPGRLCLLERGLQRGLQFGNPLPQSGVSGDQIFVTGPQGVCGHHASI